MDNARIHTAVAIKDAVRELGLRLLTNCPYTPEINAAEKFIKVHKALL